MTQAFHGYRMLELSAIKEMEQNESILISSLVSFPDPPLDGVCTTVKERLGDNPVPTYVSRRSVVATKKLKRLCGFCGPVSHIGSGLFITYVSTTPQRHRVCMSSS